jgi:hypothetical protein
MRDGLNGGAESATLDDIAKATALTRLHLHPHLLSTSLAFLTPLAPSLQHLDLDGFHTISSLEPLSSLSKLRRLDLSHFDHKLLATLLPLTTLTALNDLALGGMAAVSSLEPLAGLTSLTQLTVRRCKAISSLEPLADLGPTLLALTIAENHSLTSFSSLSTLTALSRMHLDAPHASITSEAIAAAGMLDRSLQELSLCSNRPDGRSTQVVDLQPLCSLTRLCSLKLPSWWKLCGFQHLAMLGSALQVCILSMHVICLLCQWCLRCCIQ